MSVSQDNDTSNSSDEAPKDKEKTAKYVRDFLLESLKRGLDCLVKPNADGSGCKLITFAPKTNGSKDNKSTYTLSNPARGTQSNLKFDISRTHASNTNKSWRFDISVYIDNTGVRARVSTNNHEKKMATEKVMASCMVMTLYGSNHPYTQDDSFPIERPKHQNREYVIKSLFPSEDSENKIMKKNIEGVTFDCRMLREHWPKLTEGDKLECSVPPLPDKFVENPSDSLDPDHDYCKHIAAVILNIILYRFIMSDVYSPEIDSPENNYSRHYVPTRPVDIIPHNLQTLCGDNELKFPWHVLEACCSTLNSGKHLLLYGPPGCGKTELAALLSEAAGQHPIITTASPAWTTAEVIGRYMPKPQAGGGMELEFVPGYFLDAIGFSESTAGWLIIDEFNRANIDQCFGELFTVLGGGQSKSVTLPFHVQLDNDNKNGTQEDADHLERDTTTRIHIATTPKIQPDRRSTEVQDIKNNDGGMTYIPLAFRMIGTMNDVDAGCLNQLSYALRRRFNMVRIEQPNPETIRSIIETTIRKQIKGLGHWKPYTYSNKEGDSILKDALKKCVCEVFANDQKAGGDFVQLRIVGIATIKDVINFVIESMSSQGNNKLSLKEGNITESIYESLVSSYVAIGIALNVYPQFEAYANHREKEVLIKACEVLESVFKDDFYRVQYIGSSYSITKEDCPIIDYLKSALRPMLKNAGLDEDSFFGEGTDE